MRRLGIFVFLITALASRVDAQDPPPRIGPFAVDVHMSIPAFPTDSQQLAESHSLNPGELPAAWAPRPVCISTCRRGGR